MKNFRILIGIMMFVLAVSLSVSSNASAQGQGNAGGVQAQIGDVKAVVDTIDTNTSGLGTAVGNVSTAVNNVNTTVNTVDTNTSGLGTAVGNVNTAVNNVDTTVNTINTNTSGLGAAVGNVNTAVNTIDTNTSGLGTAVTGLGTTLGGKVDQLEEDIGGVNSTLGTIGSDLSQLKLVIGDAAGVDLTNMIDLLSLKIDALNAAITTNINVTVDQAVIDGITDHVDGTIGAAEASIKQLIHDTHLVDPFDVAVTICTEIEGGAAIEGMANLGIGASLEAHLGIDFYGSGAQIGIEPAGEIGAGLNIRSDVETSVTACINGIFVRQLSDTTEEAAIIASGRNATEIALLTELIETGNRYSNRIAQSANAINLLEASPDTGSDRLNNSLNAYRAFSTLDLQKIAAIIVNTGDSRTPSTALDDFAASMPSFGLSGLLSSTGLPSVVNLGSSSVGTIGTNITNGISTLGLGSVGGLSSLTASFSNLTNLDGIVEQIEGLPSNLDSLGAIVSTIKEQACALVNELPGVTCP